MRRLGVVSPNSGFDLLCALCNLAPNHVSYFTACDYHIIVKLLGSLEFPFIPLPGPSFSPCLPPHNHKFLELTRATSALVFSISPKPGILNPASVFPRNSGSRLSYAQKCAGVTCVWVYILPEYKLFKRQVLSPSLSYSCYTVNPSTEEPCSKYRLNKKITKGRTVRWILTSV